MVCQGFDRQVPKEGKTLLTINIDTGGTFTNGHIRNGQRVYMAKVETTPHDLTVCFKNLIEEAARGFDMDLKRFLASVDVIRYSTTVGTNALIQKTGPKIGLVVTKGAEELLYHQPGESLNRLHGWLDATLITSVSEAWLALSWTSYGLITLKQVNPDVVAIIIPIAKAIPLVLGFFNGWVVSRLCRGRTKPALLVGPLLIAVGMLLTVWLNPSSYMLWAFLIISVVSLASPLFWGTINAYWAGIAAPELAGTLNGISAAVEVALGYVLLNASGSWINTSAHGSAQLTPLWLIGGIVALVSIVPILLSKEVIVGQLSPQSISVQADVGVKEA